MNSKIAIKTLYAVNAALFFAVGGIVLLYKTPVLTDSIRDIILHASKDDLNAVHLTQEFSCLMIAVGIMLVWAIRNYEHSKVLHFAITIFWGLLSLIHWMDVRGPFHSVKGSIINTIPFVLYLLASWGRME